MPKNKVCWFELYVSDMNRAKQFYSQVLGWSFTDFANPDGDTSFKMAFIDKEDQDAVGGALVEAKECADTNNKGMGTMVYFPCEDCAFEQEKIIPAGGTICRPKFAIGVYGFIVIATDTEGNTIGLHSLK